MTDASEKLDASIEWRLDPEAPLTWRRASPCGDVRIDALIMLDNETGQFVLLGYREAALVHQSEHDCFCEAKYAYAQFWERSLVLLARAEERR